jgi:hypothetical protein
MNPKDNIDSEDSPIRKSFVKKKVASKAKNATKKNASNTSKKLNKKKTKPIADSRAKQTTKDITIDIHDILKLNGEKINLTLAAIDDLSLVSKTSFITPNDQQINEALNHLETNSKRFHRLTNLLTIGFQLKQLPLILEEEESDNQKSVALWMSLFRLIEKTLRADNVLRAPSTSTSQELSALTYKNTWDDFAESKTPKTGKNRSNKQRKEARDILELDTHYSYCSGKIDDIQFIQTLAVIATASEIKNVHNTQKPRNLAAIISSLSNAETKLETARASSQLLTRLDTINYLFELEQKDKKEVHDKLDSVKQELKETENALEEESDHLKKAEDTIKQLRSDVQTAGSIYKFKLDNTQARYKGLLEGDLDRHLKLIQTCSEMEPPRTRVIIERVETTLNLLKKELKWLKDSE